MRRRGSEDLQRTLPCVSLDGPHTELLGDLQAYPTVKAICGLALWLTFIVFRLSLFPTWVLIATQR